MDDASFFLSALDVLPYFRGRSALFSNLIFTELAKGIHLVHLVGIHKARNEKT